MAVGGQQREPPLPHADLTHVLLITNSVEEAFFLFSKLEKEFNPASGIQNDVPQA